MDQLYKVLEAWMEACLEGHGIYAAQQALYVLQTMEANFDQKTSSFYTPSTSFYDIVFHAFASCQGRREAAETVQSVLQRMLNRAKKSRRYYPQPTTKTFNIALNCWAKSNEYDAGLRAEELWQVMNDWHHNCKHETNGKRPVECAPNERTMAALVEAWGNSGHEDTPQRVLLLLQQAIDQQKFQTQLVNAIVFTNAIRAVTRRKHPLGAEKAEEILRLMQQSHVQPNTRTYAAVLHAYMTTAESNQLLISKTHAAERATAILQQMIQKYREGAADVKPNVYCFTTCIAAWARCQNDDDTELKPQEIAEGLWDELLQLYLESSDPAFRPSVEAGNAVLMAWMRATHVAEAMDRGNDVLVRMRQYAKPDLRSYNILLNGMNWRGMGGESLKLIEWMEQQRPELRPDRFSFNSVLAALAKDRTLPNAQEQAEVILRRMEFSSVGADQFSYATVLDAWSRSEDTTDKARRAEALVQVMMDRYVSGESQIKPDNFIFSNWIKACIPCKRNRHQNDDASRISAFRAMEIVKSGQYCKPNYVTYTNLFRVILYTHSKEQEQECRQLLNQTLVECADGGHVSIGIRDLLQSSNVSLPSAIPASWSRSVPLRDRPLS
ncbi:hypothetical protein FisN_6Lh021 [Fistulifera solaris]|uniref:Pentacotripeptide-repeat region of PRORP domain-containing protein n=1 Tax=Fistulifera solaris TaxID=1519565 RepID=A0A1Z5KPA3_FISSO|nr:hypothetical protein FisN_6Lh021 [Fistulifera solaris]|eukprot:GAX28154.1 hypothetical protein FisN_6Lh021 [Fistulifera solaris]